MPKAEHTNFPPNSCVPLPCPPLPHPGWVNPDPLIQTCGSIPFAGFWFRHGHVTSSSQWGVRSLLGATGKGFFAPIDTRNRQPPFHFWMLCVDVGLELWQPPWDHEGDTEEDSQKDRKNMSPWCPQWAVELIYPGTTLPLDVSLREMFSVSNIEALLFGLPATSKDMHADWFNNSKSHGAEVRGVTTG